MRRVRPADALLLVSLLVLWGVCTLLHLKQIAGGQLAWVGVYVAAPQSSQELPSVRDFWPGASAAQTGGLAVGDRLIRAGDADLAGVGPFGFAARVYAAAAERGDRRVPLTYARDGVAAATTIALVPVAFPWRMLPLTCGLVLAGTLVLVRRPGTRVSRASFLLTITYALHWTFFFGGPRLQTYAWTAVFFAASVLMLPFILRALLMFPAEVAPAGPLPRWPWLFAVFGPISLSWIYGVPLPPGLGFRAVFIVNITFIAAALIVLTRNFRRASPIGRRQLKWVLLGVYVGAVPMLLADAVAAVVPSLWWLHELAAIPELAIPLCVLIAIVRANFLDVDRLITGAAVYTVLSVLVLAALLTAVPQIARAASRATDLNPSTVQLALSILVAVCLVPGQRLLRPRIERLLFRERHALRGGVEELLRDLAGAHGPEQLLTLVGERLDALLRPHSCAIYAPIGHSFVPVFVRAAEGAAAPPPLAADAVAISALRAGTGPLDLNRWVRARRASLPSGERAVLERLGAAVMLPVRRGGTLAAAICLGAKGSGDIYTDTDLTLLAAVADKVSGELLRFDNAVILGQERSMSQALRRYVPQPVVARLTRGQAIEGGERDVSVLFVDIRGYTAYSEARAADTVFSMVNRYTEAVSAVIQGRGGTVVEFLGDGLMAVFGAPEAMPEHARISVEAACEVVATVQHLALGAGDSAPIAVGVGIASGRAFVGNVRTSDRFVYTAVGDVVNLASRIQGLTRELHAAVAIDAHTHRGAGACAARFRCHERMRIRGRAEPVDVYSLPAVAA